MEDNREFAIYELQKIILGTINNPKPIFMNSMLIDE